MKSMWQLFVEFFAAKFFQFEGRASRREFISFYVFCCFVPLAAILAFALLLYFVTYTIFSYQFFIFANITAFSVIIFAVLNIIFTIVTLSLSVRRLHDFNCSGWWYILMLLFGSLTTIMLMIIPGNENSNYYREQPAS